MLIKTRKSSDVLSSEITPYEVYQSRRKFMKGTAGILLASTMASTTSLFSTAQAAVNKKLNFQKNSRYTTDEELTPYEDVTTYNNCRCL